MGLADIHPSPVYTQSPPVLLSMLVLVAVFKTTALTLLWCICKPNRYARIITLIFLGLYSMLCLVNFISYTLYGFGITIKFVTLIIQTSPREITEFIPVLSQNILSGILSWRLWLAVGSVVLTAYGVRYIRPVFFNIAIGTLSLAGLGVSSYLLVTMVQGRTPFFMSLRVSRQIATAINVILEEKELLAQYRPFPDADKVSSALTTPTIIMVVGESASRGHHSLYGYPLPTTPHLDACADSLFIFSDAIGCSPQTAGNMERILSFKPDSSVTEGDWARFPLLIDLFNAAGYTTSWLSNQEKSGIASNASYAMISQANRIAYCGYESDFDAVLMRYDDTILPELENVLADSVDYRFIGVHFLGSHNLYNLRYPSDRAHFTQKDIIAHTAPRPWLNNGNAKLVAEYDNSIAYTDSILGKIIEATSRRPEPAVMIYFSDHGENVFDTHDFCGRDDRFVEVPFIIYANSAFRAVNPDLTERIKAARELPISTSNIVHSLMTLAGISYPAYDPALDFLSPQFRPRPRYVDGQVWRYEHIGKQ